MKSIESKYNMEDIMRKKVVIALVFCLLGTYRALNAEDVELKLNSGDGSTKFAIQDSAGTNVATIDSQGNLVLEGSATIKGGLIGHKFPTEAQNSGVSLTTDDFGKTITIDSASNQTVVLPSVTSSHIGAWVRIIKLGTGKVTVDAPAGHFIADSGDGGTIYNGASSENFATITLQLTSADRWNIAGGCGTWITTQ